MQAILRVDVATGAEQGLLGIAIWNDDNGTSVFLYMTERDGEWLFSSG